jgi:hypothetical protein
MARLLAADDTPHLPVMQHALTWLRDHDQYAGLGDDSAAHIPTATAVSHQEAVALAVASGADSVVSVDELPPHTTRCVSTIDATVGRAVRGGQPVSAGDAARTCRKPVLNGAVICFAPGAVRCNRAQLMATKSRRRMSPPHSLNIDDPED